MDHSTHLTEIEMRHAEKALSSSSKPDFATGYKIRRSEANLPRSLDKYDEAFEANKTKFPPNWDKDKYKQFVMYWNAREAHIRDADKIYPEGKKLFDEFENIKSTE
jgi:hypothetical protein